MTSTKDPDLTTSKLTPRTRPSGMGWGLTAAIISATAFASSGPFVKPLLDAGWSPAGAVFVRVLGAAVLLVPFVLWSVRGDPRVIIRRWGWIVVYGTVAIGTVQMAYFFAIDRLPVGIALLVEYLAPVLLLLATWVITRVRPAWLALLGAVSAVVGLVLIINPFGSGMALDPIGILWAFLAAVSLAAYLLMSANIPDDLPPIALIGGGLSVAAAGIGLMGALRIVPLEMPFANEVLLLDSVVPWWVPMLIVVLVGTLAGYVLGLFAAKRLGSRIASFAGVFEVVAAMVIAALLLSEIPTALQVVGAVFIVGGVIAVRLAPDHSKPTASGGVPDVVGTVTGAIPLPSVSDELSNTEQVPHAAADPQSKRDGG